MDDPIPILPSSASFSDKLTSDYINITIHTLCILIGIPVNISTLIYILNRYKHGKSFLLLLHINLNITDILVLAVHCTGHVVWLITYEWKGGDTLCKVMRFFDIFVFSSSSNIMVCIAVYRLCALRSPIWVSAVGHSRIPRVIVLAWTMATLVSLPQLFVWTEQTALIDNGDGSQENITQCVSLWINKMYKSNGSLTVSEQRTMQAYSLSQLVVIFYLPLAILLTCYVLILKDIYSTLNIDCDESSVLYVAEVTRLSSCSKKRSQAKASDAHKINLHTRTLRGQDKFQRVKIRSLRITLILILTYIITWFPYNLLSWLMIDFEFYRQYEDILYFLHAIVVFNSVVNPFIYGRCQGLRLLLRCESNPRTKARVNKGLQMIECCM